jgi:hypothetical protein
MSAEFASQETDTDTAESSDESSSRKKRKIIKAAADRAIEAEQPRRSHLPLAEFFKSSNKEEVAKEDEAETDDRPERRAEAEPEQAERAEQAEDIDQAVDMEADLDQSAEEPAAVQQLAEFQLAEAEERPLPETPEDKAAELAARNFLAKAAESGDIEASAAEAKSDMGATEHETAEDRPEPLEPEAEAPMMEVPKEFEEDEAEIDLRRVATEEPPRDQEALPEQPENDEEPPAPNGTSNGMPPHGPHGPNGPDGSEGHNLYTVPYGVAAGATQERQGHVPEYDQGNPAVTALIGGIIGYIIGKRRGRRLEQRKLLPVQKKLEKQVTNLHWELKAKENEIRRVAARKAQIEGAEFMRRLDRAVEKTTAKADRREFRKMELAAASQRQRAPEAHHLHGSLKSHERIGQVLIAAESAAPIVARRPEAAQPYKEELRRTVETTRPITDRRAETLNRAELLQLSERIMVDGTSLRQIYESKLIGERGLRRLLAEHLRGGDVKKVLRQEIIEREIDFERDPILRDQPAHGGAAGGGTDGSKANPAQLKQLLAKAGASLPDSSEETAFYKARTAYEMSEREQQQKHKQMMDTAFVGIIIILLGLVVWLALSRG